ncbi:uncharacterized protein LOC135484842 [Lineus longissimus]|uniref:uncharacterized protein LOC135484842 n=1 Tax=Lineus longissimus TaxID=88925 RepID=UPI00315D275B
MESPHASKKVGKPVKATLTSTKLAGKKTDDGVVVDVSTISGDGCHGGIEGETTEFESVPVPKQADGCHGGIEEDSAEFESLPLQKEAGKVVKVKLTSTMLPGKKTKDDVVVDVSTISGDDGCHGGIEEDSAEFESLPLQKEAGKVVKVKLTSTMLPGKKTKDDVVVDVSTISGDDGCHGGIEEDSAEFESLPLQKEAGKVVKVKLTSTMLPGKKTKDDVVVDVSTISGDHSHGFVCSENESAAINSWKSPAVPVKKVIGKVVKAKLTSTMLSGEMTADGLVMDMSTIHEETEGKSLQRQAEKTPIQTTKRSTVTSKLKKLHSRPRLKKEGKLQPKNSTLLFPREDGKQPMISNSNINCSAVVADSKYLICYIR